MMNPRSIQSTPIPIPLNAGMFRCANRSTLVSRRSLQILALTFVLPVLICGQTTFAQLRDARRGTAPRAAILERNAPIESLLRKATGAIERKDWKLAIDSLQRILDDPGGALLSPDDDGAGIATGLTMYESAQDRATALLAAMPEEGIEAYRLLYDGRAKALFDRGVKDCNETALRTILARYMVSSYGDDAANVVAAWLLDRNRPAEALEVLDRMTELSVQPDVPEVQIAVRRAITWTMLRNQSKARGSLESLPEESETKNDAEYAAILKFVEAGWPESSVESAAAGHESWPLRGGDLSRRFQMPAVTPELEGNLPWRYILPADHEHPSWWEAYWESSVDALQADPVGEYAVSQGRLFVKNLQQVVALDLESLDPLWISERPISIDGEQRRNVRSNNAFQRFGSLQLVDTSYTLSDQIFADHVGGALSAAFGKVYAIERDGVGKSPNQTKSNPGFSFHSFSVYRGTRLIAYNAEHGQIVWQRGRSGDSDDQLGDVQFLSAPIAIQDELWVVYASQTDLYLGVLSPSDGTMSRNLLLCTVDPAQLQRRQHFAIYPASDGSHIFISTGFGVVLSVSIDPLSLRWAGQYEQQTGYDNVLFSRNWRCGPPVLAGGLLLVAAPDSDLLMALDRATGRVVWTLNQPGGAKYLLGVDDDHVWLGGEQLHCVNIHDGWVEWSTSQAALRTTGRGALSGDRIFVPTVAGLATYNAQTGEQLETHPLGDQPPLGNLLCIANSTISIDPNEVRKFPDLTLSYPSALAFHERDPTDRHAAIRLAWMELRRGFPRRAHEVLEKVKPPTRRSANRLSDVTQLRFEALLGIATLPDTGTEEAIEKLREAVSLADGGQSSLRATIALAFRLRDVGATDEAYVSLWNLGLTPSGDGYVTIESRLRNKARLVIGDILSRFERDLTTAQLRSIAEVTQQVAEVAIAELSNPSTKTAARLRLEQLAQMNDVGGAGQAALIALANVERDRGQFEFAEHYALQAIESDRMATQTAVALRDLAEQYVRPDQRLHFEASQLLSRLENEFARQSLPSSTAATVSVMDEVRRLRAMLDPIRITETAFASSPKSFCWKSPTVNVNRDRTGQGMFTYPPKAAGIFSDVLMFMQSGSRLEAINRTDGSDAWSATLRLLGSVQSPPDPDEPKDEIEHPRLTCEKQIAVINGRDGLFGVGVLTGRRLWGVEYEDSGSTHRLAIRDRLMAVDDGLLVAAFRRGVLTCSSLIDANDVQWERVLPREKIDSIFVQDGLCITLDNKREKATTYDLKTGRLLSTVEFNQSNTDAIIPVIYESGHLIGPDGSGSVVCYSARSGEVNWRYEVTDKLRWLFKPGDGYVGISCLKGRVLLIDALAGDVRMEMTVPKDTKGYAEGVLLDNRLILMPVTENSRGDDADLYGVDADTGQVVWKREDLGVVGLNRHALWQQLTLAVDVMPVLRRVDVDSESPLLRNRGELAIELIDKRTGQRIGELIRTQLYITVSNALTGEFGLWPGQFILGANHGLLSVPLADEVGAMTDTAVTDMGERP
ncbi:MAG TPA: PQQ-binding-like beta-propeller repeat protein [Phycisphaerae bacterium]|nr:PQQ-binding-like beta-propeller repeat protein [Phycisphaerae bacterium]